MASTRPPRTFLSAWTLAALCAFVASGLPGASEAARRDYYFQSIGSEQGLPQHAVNAMMQDRTGFVWVATQGWLHRYDGYAFRAYRHQPGDAALPASFVTAMVQDNAGQFWIGTHADYDKLVG